MGLGKMGGAALGYASDIELLFVYSDAGSTGGPETLENAEFFARLAREVQRLVHAKREGIFHIDLRLRPYGDAGPLACSLESFCTYYARGGPAHSYEKLALVRLRSAGGDKAIGERIERIRDDMIYAAGSIDLGELRGLRERQAREKTRAETPNAKFSPGALVDMEYTVQILQVMHGAGEKRLRTPKLTQALDELASIGVLQSGEAVELVAAYHFFRRLINGLRMLRGSAHDLFLPAIDSNEYMHLARRSGYTPDREMSPAQKLHLDFETHTAEVRAFVERHFGRGSLPGAPAVNVADLILSDSIPAATRNATLEAKGFRDPARAFVNLRNIAGIGENGESPERGRRSLFARLAILACDILAQKPDPGMALNNWERFLHELPDPKAHLSGVLSQPMRLEILMSIFATSQFLADALVREPALLDFIGRSDVLNSRGRNIAEDLARLRESSADRESWLDSLRGFRRREILLIGARDICLGIPTRTIMEEISALADAVIDAALGRIRAEMNAVGFRFCVIAFGKLGGRELNYSSDIDLLGLCDAAGGDDAMVKASTLMERLRADLSSHTTEGHAYRVDLRLRPYGSSGQLVFSLKSLLSYYEGPAALWELQALLKARPVAGDLGLGGEFLQGVKRLLTAPRNPAVVTSSINRIRREAAHGTTDVKVGLGGIRDVEFLVQGLQLIHAHENPGLVEANTLAALEILRSCGILPADAVERLSGDYIFLRRVEHFLQIYEDRQIHSLPRDPEQMRALARRMLGSGATAEQFQAKLARRFERVHEEYLKFVGEARV
jgi:glutamate-ammonia-ligase adenylyltransferase